MEVDLSSLQNSRKFKLWGILAINWLKKLYNLFSKKSKEKVEWYDWTKTVESIETAQLILKVLFENIGMNVI
jgi:hypothetical protein